MTIESALQNYIEAGNSYAADYGVENPVLTQFRSDNNALDAAQTDQLVALLSEKRTDWNRQIFVADLLYYYDQFDEALLSSMLDTGIEFLDPSFNRIFLRPCLNAFGPLKVVDRLSLRFKTGNSKTRIGISNLCYWLKCYDVDFPELQSLMLTACRESENIVELYYYRMAMPEDFSEFETVPDHATALINEISGDAGHERLLYDELGWNRT